MEIRTDSRVVNYLKRKIKDSRNIVAVLGIEMIVEGGGYDLDCNDENYRVEEEYGFSPEDMLSTSFFNAKVEKFYRFYKKEILGMEMHSTAAYDALLKLQDQGKLSAVICQNFHGIPQNVHLKNVIDLNGNIKINQCPHCDKAFDIQYIANAKGIPQCDHCKMAIRPGIRLLGERVDSELMTQAAIACDGADILLILGKNMYNDRLEYTTALEREQLKVLFSKNEFECNGKVDFIIRDDICEFLPLIIN
ncbi:MAG: NAD-dependent deacetylase [Lachnospiraceae bacterium]|jgi:NAD-dependent deacetylase|nr:NAD-dependent deacetylase [Lachnospiraceae bacterium]